MADKTLDQIAEEARVWLLSQPGQAALKHAIQEVNLMSSELQKACELKPETLNEPVTL